MLSRPLACCALALTAGTLIAPAGLSPVTWCALAACLLSGGLILAAASARRDPVRLGSAMVLLGFGCLGGLARDVSGAIDPSDVGEMVARHGSLLDEGVEVRGRIARAPTRCPDRLVEAPCLDVTVDLTGITLMRIPGPATGRVQLRILGFGRLPRSTPIPIRRGDRIRAHARLFVPHTYRNPGSFDAVGHLRGRGIRALGSVKSPRLVQVTCLDDPGARLSALRSVDRLGETLSFRIDAALAQSRTGRRAAAIGKALLLGDASHLDPDDSEVLRGAGVSHLLAVSGFHVGVVAAALLLLARAAALPRRWRFVAILPALFLFLLINHAHSSLDRAVAMATLTFVGRAVWRSPDPLNSAGLALLIVLGREPGLVHDAGFQLSFAATASLLIAFMQGRIARSGARSNRIARWARGAALAAIAVLLGTLPISIMHFNRVTPGAIAGNLLIGPLMAASLIALLLLECLATFPGQIHAPLAPAIVHLVGWSFGIARFLGSVPLLSYRRATPGPLVPFLYYSALAALLRDRTSPPLRRVAAGVFAVALLVLLIPIDTREAPEGLRVTVLDVGQGDATLLETAAGDRLLVDAGTRTRNGFDVGERVVSRALWSMGIASIGVLVVTHADADHAGGAAAIVRNFKPRLVLVPAGSSSWLDRPVTSPFRLALAETGTPLTEVSDGVSICLPGGCIRVLNPSRARAGGAAGNESSIVLRLAAAGRGVLLPGDAGSRTEALIGSRGIGSDVLKVGHHGSRTSSSAPFLDRVRPRIAVISCGAGNRFGHPHPEVLRRLESRSRLVLRTDRDGAVEILLTPSATLLGDLPAGGRRGLSRRGTGAE